jgi:hypothetical protein
MSKSIFVEGRKWLDRSAGNTYWSSRVWVDGSVAFQLPMNYGYGEMYLQSSLEECVKRGIVLYTSASQVLKREMFRRWTPESDK